MTRINCIPPCELSGPHLVAEYRELPRVYKLAASAFDRTGGSTAGHPAEYRLGSGHVTFFFSRLDYVRRRHADLVAEMLRRGYHPTYQHTPELSPALAPWANDWTPTPEAMALNRERIAIRNATQK